MAYKDLPAHGFDGFWWRCEVRHFATLDTFSEDVIGSSTSIRWRKFVPIRSC